MNASFKQSVTSHLTSDRYAYERTTWKVVICLLGVCLLTGLLLPNIGPGYVRLATEFSLYLSLAIMWNLLAGYAGLLSVGQQAYVGIGAYTFYAAFVFAGLPLAVCLFVAMVVGAIAALGISPFLFRLRGPYFAVGTWVVAEIALLTFAAWDLFGGGAGISIPVKIARQVGRTAADRDLAILVVTMVILAISLAGSYALLRSKIGLAMTAIRDSERAAESLGINTLKTKLLIYLATAFVTAGIGGVIFVTKLRMTPDSAFSLIDWTAYVLFIVIIGGIGRFEGPIIGTLVFFILRTIFADYGVFYLILLGGLAILVMLKAPNGLWGLVSHRTKINLFPLRREYRSIKNREVEMSKYEMITQGKIVAAEMVGSLFDGQFKPSSGKPVPVTDKATGEVIFESGTASIEDVNKACERAVIAQKDWAELSPIARGGRIAEIRGIV